MTKNTCGTCRFRKTGYCPHPNTNFEEASRCLECEILSRIEMFENHTIVGVAEKPKVAVAKQWLEEWVKEQEEK